MKPSEPEKAVKLFIQFSQNEAFHGEAARSPLLHADIMLMAIQMSTLTPLHVAINYPRWLYTGSLLINLTDFTWFARLSVSQRLTPSLQVSH